MQRKLTFIWQDLSSFEESRLMSEYEWITEVFKPLLGEQVFDREPRTVLDNCLLIDAYPRSHSREYYRQFRGKNAWLFHRADETYEGGYEVYSNFRGVFRTYWGSIFDPGSVMQIPLGFSNGMLEAASRSERCRAPIPMELFGRRRKDHSPRYAQSSCEHRPQLRAYHRSGAGRPLGKTQYKQILRDSVFVPCCMGNVNLDSYRVYEALECGAVPILEKRISLDYFRQLLGDHPMPSFMSWRQAASFLNAIQRR